MSLRALMASITRNMVVRNICHWVIGAASQGFSNGGDRPSRLEPGCSEQKGCLPSALPSAGLYCGPHWPLEEIRWQVPALRLLALSLCNAPFAAFEL